MDDQIEKDFAFDPKTDPDEATESGKALMPLDKTLPGLMLDASLSAENRRRINDEALFTRLHVPSESWTDILADWCRRDWTYVISAKPDKKSRARAADGLELGTLMERIRDGHRALLITYPTSPKPPAPLIAAIDLDISIAPPTGKLIRQSIEAATGEDPGELDDSIADGLDFDALGIAIRCGSQAADCIRRLAEAREAHQKRFDCADDDAIPDIDDLYGYGPAMIWARDLRTDIAAYRSGRIPFSAVEQGAVLWSDPGLGKTTFVRSLSKSLRMPLIATSVGQWFAGSPGHLDSIIKQIDQVFADAAASAPSILFLDEIEALPNRRTLGSRNADWWMPVIGHMLLKLDSAISSDTGDVIVIAATNHADRLDEALVRPGRLNRIIRIEPPDRDARAGILRQHLGSDLAGTDLMPIAALSAGCSGADIMGWTKSARRRARNAGRAMNSDDLIAEIAPPETRSEADLRLVAIHEAAHAVITAILGGPTIDHMTIVPGNGALGRTQRKSMAGTIWTREMIEAEIMSCLAGRCGEIHFFGRPTAGAGGAPDSDLGAATRWATMMHISFGLGDVPIYLGDRDEAFHVLRLDPGLQKKVAADLARLETETARLVASNADRIQRLADVLRHERVIGAERIAEVLDLPETAPTPGLIGGKNE